MCFRRYVNNAKRLSNMLHNQLVSPEELVVRWVEHVAKCKTLSTFDAASTRMTVTDYNNLDVMVLTLLVFILTILYVSSP